jgi:hypothetical protein
LTAQNSNLAYEAQALGHKRLTILRGRLTRDRALTKADEAACF